MAIILFSIVASMVLGCIVWLVIGDKFPLAAEVKFPPLNNITIYVLLLIIPVYAIVFTTF
ncbi:MAG: hypothetical protein ABGY96_13250 [bacterium]|nr:hypothetical protein [Gammaproteobacteria bacterium]HIL94653.1 hypothetical protein [Pseudomonadales bacterium]